MTTDLRALTGLRWVAALWVFLFHAHIHLGWLSKAWLSVTRPLSAGGLGVTLFFILSGFLLAYAYLTPSGALTVTPGVFWRSRLARIWPLAALAILLMVPLQAAPTSLGAPQMTLGSVAALTLTQAWVQPLIFAVHGGTWSLSCEAFFYLLFPLLAPVVARLSTRHLRGALLILWIAAGLVGAVYLAFPDEWSALYASPALRLPEFLSGVTLGVLFRRSGSGRDAPQLALLSALALVLALVVWGSSVSAPLHNGVAVPLLGLLIYHLAQSDGAGGWVRVLESWPAQALGRWSFAFYLLQPPAFYMGAQLQDAGVGVGWVVLAVLALNLVLAFLGHVLVEVPARQALLRRAAQATRPVPVH